jgi:hypothetical protein
VLPTVAGHNGGPKNVNVFLHAYSFIRGHGGTYGLLIKLATCPRAVAELEDPAVGLAGVRESLSLPEVDLQEPFASSGLWQADRTSLAVVKDMRGLVDDEVVESVV